MNALDALSKIDIALIKYRSMRQTDLNNSVEMGFNKVIIESDAEEVSKATEALQALNDLSGALLKAGLMFTDLNDFNQFKPKTDLERLAEDMEGAYRMDATEAKDVIVVM